MSKENKKYIDEQIDALLRQKPDIVISREELKKQFDSRETLDEFIAYVKGLNHLTEDFDQLMNEIKAKIQVFQEQHPLQLTTLAVFHIEDDHVSKDTRGKQNIGHCLTNILEDKASPEEKANIAEILYHNCEISFVFREIIKNVYLCCQRNHLK
jgi:hypothetical protein